MKKVLVVVVVCVAALGAGSWIYLGSDAYAYTSTHFPRHTWINHVDCSGLTCHQAKQKLTEVWNRKTYKIERNGTVIGTIGAFDYSYEIDQQLQNLMGTGIFKALRNQFSDKHQYRTVKMTPKTTKSFDRQIRSMSFLYRPYTVKTKNAYVDLNHKAMNIVKEVRGNNIDPDRFTRKIKHDIAKGRFSMEYTPSDYYALPSVTSSDTLLKKRTGF